MDVKNLSEVRSSDKHIFYHPALNGHETKKLHYSSRLRLKDANQRVMSDDAVVISIERQVDLHLKYQHF
jgi:hypothetical protein